LEKIGDPRAVPALIDALKDEDTYVLTSVKEALVNIGKPTVSALIDALKDKDEDIVIRIAVAEVLGKIGDPKAVPALIDALKDKNEKLSNNAANALGKIGESSINPLIKVLEETEEDNVCKNIALTLGEIEKKLQEDKKNLMIPAIKPLINVWGEIEDNHAINAIIGALRKILNLAPHIKEYFSKKQINLNEKALGKMEIKRVDGESFKKELINTIELYFSFEKHNVDFSKCLEYLINNQRIQDIKNLYSSFSKNIPETTKEINFIQESKEKIDMLLYIASNQEVIKDASLEDTAKEKMQKYSQKPTEKETIKALKNIDNKIYGREQQSKDLDSGEFIIEEKSKSKWRKFFDEKIK
ncbi:MAG: HEAT repeat domain-containing protein, partial [Candidatus Aenigmarchaeota archaeon]|nr:HEAT repeat domain-containing protein [Candidatus Aenigmarchaeota archaeon]